MILTDVCVSVVTRLKNRQFVAYRKISSDVYTRRCDSEDLDYVEEIQAEMEIQVFGLKVILSLWT